MAPGKEGFRAQMPCCPDPDPSLIPFVWLLSLGPHGGREAARSFRLTSFQAQDSREDEISLLQYFHKQVSLHLAALESLACPFLHQSLHLENCMLRADGPDIYPHPGSSWGALPGAPGLTLGGDDCAEQHRGVTAGGRRLVGSSASMAWPLNLGPGAMQRGTAGREASWRRQGWSAHLLRACCASSREVAPRTGGCAWLWGYMDEAEALGFGTEMTT